ncbi:hypothetical protein LTR37_011314 [Vermiconidia calcicola]|uniref:Uncharacterized protein n=1 Tax=Vermiconidia calcicola TaxID=1690605 RepID=A0ACC3N2H7_9PEZI|nr:hypothetical protein LTR37_011314 [Vermiconidia calcicola]
MKSFAELIRTTSHLDLDDIPLQEMNAKQHRQQQSQMIHLFDLPQELRDKIYDFYSFASPCREGPLKGYVKPAPPVPLRVCKRMLDELAPIYYAGLKEALIQHKVCLTLRTRILLSDRCFLLGWNLWTIDDRKSLHVWMRDAAEEENEIGWWADVTTLSPKGMVELDERSRKLASVRRVLSAVEALLNLERAKERKVERRLEAVRSRIGKRIEEVLFCAVGKLMLTESEGMQ